MFSGLTNLGSFRMNKKKRYKGIIEHKFFRKKEICLLEFLRFKKILIKCCNFDKEILCFKKTANTKLTINKIR